MGSDDGEVKEQGRLAMAAPAEPPVSPNLGDAGAFLADFKNIVLLSALFIL
jgi:hypothetical protein